MRYKESLLLCLILLLALWIRLYGIDFGLPHPKCRPDEDYILLHSLRFFTGDLNPHFFNYPSLYLYLLFLLYFAYGILRLIMGASSDEIWIEIATNPTNFFLISRMLSAMFGVITVGIIFIICRGWFGKNTAFIASFFMSICYLHVRDSHFGTVDIAMTCFIMCAILFLIKSYHHQNLRNATIAGIFTGLATSTKYAGIILIIPMFFCQIANYITASSYSTVLMSLKKCPLKTCFLIILSVLTRKNLWIYIVAAILSFFVCTPFAIGDFRQFAHDFFYEMQHVKEGHGLYLGKAWKYHGQYTLPYGLGWGIFLSSLCGILLYLKKYPIQAILLFAYPCFYYLSIGGGKTVFLRYMIPVLPFLCIASAIFLSMICAKFNQQKYYILLIYGLSIFFAIESLYHCILFNGFVSKKDNRVIAAEWVMKNLPQGSAIYHTTNPPVCQIQLPSTLSSLRTQLSQPLDWVQRKLFDAELSFREKNELNKGYQNVFYLEQGVFPDYIITQTSPQKHICHISKPLRYFLARHYTLKKSFHVVDIESSNNWYDQLDALFIPFIGFGEIERPGPNIFIYEYRGKQESSFISSQPVIPWWNNIPPNGWFALTFSDF